jgi:phosphatidylserine decarboxylase
MQQLPMAPEGLVYVLISLTITVMLCLIWPWLAIVGILLVLFMAFFFRNPRREGPEMPDALLSPADGRIMSINEMAQTEFIDGPAVRITIFLSIFNVHINRSPMTGTVLWRQHRPGQFLPAFKSHASDLNERNAIGIDRNGYRIVVHQITGFVARRIVCDVRPGDPLCQRQRFGLIRFGSCAELICPAGTSVLVRPGDKVRGGQTILARLTTLSEVADAAQESA